MDHIRLFRDVTPDGHVTYGPRKPKISALPGVDPTNPKKIKFQGCVMPAPHMEGHNTKQDRKDNFTAAERQKLNLVDLDVSIEHEYDYYGDGKSSHVVVGKILRQWFTEDGELMVEGEVDPKTYHGNLAKTGLLDGELRGLSLAHHALEVSLSSDSACYIKTPREVSLCKKGKRVNTEIDEIVCASAPVSTFEEELTELVTSILMSQANTQQQQAAPATQASTNAPADAAPSPAKDVPMTDAAPASAAPVAGKQPTVFGPTKTDLVQTNTQLLIENKKREEEKAALAKELEELRKANAELAAERKKIEEAKKAKEEKRKAKFIEANKDRLNMMAKTMIEARIKSMRESGVDVEQLSKKQIAELEKTATEKAYNTLSDPDTFAVMSTISVHSKAAADAEQTKKELEYQKHLSEFYRLHGEANGISTPAPTISTPATQPEPMENGKRTREESDEWKPPSWFTASSMTKMSAGNNNDKAEKQAAPGVVTRKDGIKALIVLDNDGRGPNAAVVSQIMDAREAQGARGEIRAFSGDPKNAPAVSWEDFNLLRDEAFLKEYGLERCMKNVQRTDMVQMSAIPRNSGSIYYDRNGNQFHANNITTSNPGFVRRLHAFNYSPEMSRYLLGALNEITGQGTLPEQLKQAQDRFNADNNQVQVAY